MAVTATEVSVFKSAIAQETANRITNKTAKIGIVGLGYVGLPLALEFSKKGFSVHGIDISAEKISMLKRGENYIEDLNDEEIREAVRSGKLIPENNFNSVSQLDVIYICVPTPFTENKEPDIHAILSATKGVADGLRKGQMIILKSTTYPGTTENDVQPVLESTGLKAGKDFFLAFSPERVDPGNKKFNTANTPIVIGGIESDSTELGALANEQIIQKVHRVSNPKVAEMEKLLENIFRSVNIALANELALLCERMPGLNIWEVIEAAGTKPFGYMKFLPGPGVGGHCIPIDPYYLSWLARAYDFETRFITLSANVNESMPYHIRDLVIHAVSKTRTPLMDARILVLGASFKKNVRDLRHSPAEVVISLLWGAGLREVDYNDPTAPEFHVKGKKLRSVALTRENISSYDALVLITDHDKYDMDFILEHCKCLIDTRNASAAAGIHSDKAKRNKDKVVLMGRKGT